MRFSKAFLASVAAATIAFAPSAFAECKRYGFSVNDYGKDGPTKDAKALLDKHIAGKMAALGVTNYKTGTKSVKCELFLDFIVFDEHTCTAEATVCWNGSQLPKSQQAATEQAVPTTTGSIEKPAKDQAAKKAKPEPAPEQLAPKAEAEPAAKSEEAPAADATSTPPAATHAAAPQPEAPAPAAAPVEQKPETPAAASDDKPAEHYETLPADAPNVEPVAPAGSTAP